MATLTGQKVKNSYKDLLQVSNSNSGIDGTLRSLIDGENTSSVLQLSSSAVNITGAGTLQYGGTAISATAAELNILDGVTTTAAELNVLDGITAGTVSASLGVVVDSNKDIGTFRNITLSGELDAGSLDISGDADIDGTLETDALTIGGVTSVPFESADHSKLDGIEASADVTDTANVTSAGALMDSEVTNLAFVKSLAKGISDGNVLTANDAVADNDFLRIDGTEVEGLTVAEVLSALNVESGATADQTDEEIQDIAGPLVATGGTKTGIAVTYDDTNGNMDFVVDHDSASNFVANEHINHTSVEIATGTGLSGGGDISSTRTLSVDAAQTGITSLLATDIKIGEDDETKIDFETADTINFYAGNEKQLILTDGALTPGADNILDLGSSGVEFKDAYFDGTVTSDAFAGPLTGDVTGNVSGTAATVTGAAQTNITSLGTLTALTVDNVSINGSTIGHTGDTDLMTVASGVLTVAGEVDATSLDISGDADIDGTLEADAITVNGTALSSVIAGTTVTLASTVTVSDSTANTNFPVVFHDESNALLDDTGALRYNPSTGELLVPKLTVAGTTTQVDTVTMEAANAIVFEGATADSYETTLSIVDPTADHTQYLINQGGYIPVLAAATTTAITSTPAELNVLDGYTGSVTELNYLDTLHATGVTNTEFDYLDGVTSNIQTQLDATLDTAGTGIDISSTTISVDVSDFMANGSDNRIVTATGTDAMNAESTLTFDGSSNLDLLSDSGKLRIGAGNDLEIYHNGTNDYIDSGGTSIFFRQGTTEKLKFNSGGNIQFNNAQADINTRFATTGGLYTLWVDGGNDNVGIGTNDPASYNNDGDDFVIYGTGDTGMSIVSGTSSDGSLIFADGTSGTSGYRGKLVYEHDNDAMTFYTAATLQATFTSAGNLILEQELFLKDSKDLVLGNGSDLQIQHNGTDNIINNATSDQDLYIKVNDGGSSINALHIDSSAVGHIKLPNDGQVLSIGAGDDLVMQHDGTNTYIDNNKGNLNIGANDADKDLILLCDDGSGGSTAYLTLDGSAERIQFSKKAYILDNVKFEFGDGADLQIYHNGTDNIINNATSDQDLYIKVNDGGSSINALHIDSSAVGHIKLPNDGQVLSIGAGDDLVMQHDGTNTYIDNNKGNLNIGANDADKDLILLCDDGSGGSTAYLTLDGSATRTNVHKDLRLDNSVNLSLGGGGNMSMSHDGSNATFSNATGNLTIQTSTDDGDVIFRCDDGSGGTTAYITLDGSVGYTTAQKNIRMNDNVNLLVGTSEDASFYHDGSDTFIQNGTGNFYIRQLVDDADLIFQCDNGSGGNATYFYLDGSITKTTFNQDVRIVDSKKIGFGNADDLEIYHDGTDDIINTKGTAFKLLDNGTERLRINSSGNIVINENGNSMDFRVEGDTVTNLLFVDGSADRVGIGTNSPTGKLEVVSSDGTETLRLHNSDVTITENELIGEMLFTTADSTLNSDRLVIGAIKCFAEENFNGANANEGSLAFYTANATDLRNSGSPTARMVIDEDGNVGIGTTSPTNFGSGFTNLQISGSTAGVVQTTDSTNSATTEMMTSSGVGYVGTRSNHQVRFKSNNTTAMTIDTSQRVGIGTTSPRVRLDLGSNGISHLRWGSWSELGEVSSHNSLVLGNNIYVDGSSAKVRATTSDGYRAIKMKYNEGITFHTVQASVSADDAIGNERMRINQSGNVGIGTSSPSYNLHVKSASGSHAEVRIETPDQTSGSVPALSFNNGDRIYSLGVMTDESFSIRDGSDSWATRLSIDTSGNVGIGETSVDAKLHLTTASSGLINQKFESAGSAAWRMGIAASGTSFLLDDSHDDLSTPEFAFQNDGDFHADGDVIAYSTTTSSDERLKENIKQIPYGLEEVLKMKPVEYDWKEKRGGKHDIGVIAQDIEKLIPEIIKENKDLKTKEDFKSVDYGKMVAVLIKAIQEQQEEIELLKANLDQLKYNRR